MAFYCMFIHLSVNGHLSYFPLFVIINNISDIDRQYSTIVHLWGDCLTIVEELQKISS